MSLHPSLELLKHGLSVLKETVKKCKDGLTAQLRKKEKISEQVMEDSTDEEIFEAVQKMRDDCEKMKPMQVMMAPILHRTQSQREKTHFRLCRYCAGISKMNMGHIPASLSLASRCLDGKLSWNVPNT
jgi:hypothetical protein